MTHSRLVPALVFLAAIAGLSQTPPVDKPAFRKSGATERSRIAPAPPSDAELERTIRARFAKSKIAVNNFEVYVLSGVARIEGRTDVLQHKGVATRLARSAGAAGVVNRIEVSQAAKNRAAGNLAKARKRAQVKRGEPRSAVPR